VNWPVVEVPTHPLRSGHWTNEIVRLRDNATQEVREFVQNTIIEPGEEHPSEFIWEEGNYSCACNRRLFFARAGNEDDPEEHPCGDGPYAVQLLHPETREVFYDEF
jgi:hypothetical protein